MLALLISRLERRPPSHLADLAIVQTTEFHYREKRFRYFTLDNALILASTLSDFELSQDLPTREEVAEAGSFRSHEEEEFYRDKEDLDRFLSKWDGRNIARSRGTGKPKAPKPPKPRKEKKEKKWVNPILPDGSRKRGRPRKDSKGDRGVSAKKARSMTEDGDAREDSESAEEQATKMQSSTTTLKRKREDEDIEEASFQESFPASDSLLFPADDRRSSVEPNQNTTATLPAASSMGDDRETETAKRKKGRPPKKRRKVDKASNTGVADAAANSLPVSHSQEAEATARRSADDAINEGGIDEGTLATVSGLPYQKDAPETSMSMSVGDERRNHDQPKATPASASGESR